MEAVFLGLNDAGEEVYNWLNRREDVEVLALLTEKEQLSLIKDLEPEIVIASGFEHKVPEEIIEVPEKGIVNLHPSFLPYNRGSHPYIWPIVEDTPAGVSLHYMNSEIDEGPVIDRREVPVLPEDTAETLYERLQEEQVIQFKENWKELKQGADAREQREGGATHYRKDLDDLCKLDLQKKTTIGNLIDRLRALSFPPHETAYFERNGKKYYINVEISEE
jgi:methionyl-tRNA formyltransferase